MVRNRYQAPEYSWQLNLDIFRVGGCELCAP
jgi:hypothetical protein